MCAHVDWWQVTSSNFSSLYIETVFHSNLELINLASLVSQLAWEIACLCLLRVVITGRPQIAWIYAGVMDPNPAKSHLHSECSPHPVISLAPSWPFFYITTLPGNANHCQEDWKYNTSCLPWTLPYWGLQTRLSRLSSTGSMRIGRQLGLRMVLDAESHTKC